MIHVNRMSDDPDGIYWKIWNDRHETIGLTGDEIEDLLVEVARHASPRLRTDGPSGNAWRCRCEGLVHPRAVDRCQHCETAGPGRS